MRSIDHVCSSSPAHLIPYFTGNIFLLTFSAHNQAHERAFIRLALDSGILGLFTDPNHPGVELGVDEISALTHVDQALTSTFPPRTSITHPI